MVLVAFSFQFFFYIYVLEVMNTVDIITSDLWCCYAVYVWTSLVQFCLYFGMYDKKGLLLLLLLLVKSCERGLCFLWDVSSLWL